MFEFKGKEMAVKKFHVTLGLGYNGQNINTLNDEEALGF